MALTANYAVQINGNPIAIVGKVKFKKGYPKVTVKTASVGENVVPYEDVDYTEAVGSITIKVPNTVKNQELVDDLQKNRGKNALHLTDAQSEAVVVYKQQSISEDIEFDGEDFEITLTGGQGL